MSTEREEVLQGAGKEDASSVGVPLVHADEWPPRHHVVAGGSPKLRRDALQWWQREFRWRGHDAPVALDLWLRTLTGWHRNINSVCIEKKCGNCGVADGLVCTDDGGFCDRNSRTAPFVKKGGKSHQEEILHWGGHREQKVKENSNGFPCMRVREDLNFTVAVWMHRV